MLNATPVSPSIDWPMHAAVCTVIAALMTVASATEATADALCEAQGVDQPGSVWIDGGTFVMGAADQHPEERAVHEVTVEGFSIDRHEVTNTQFGHFVEATRTSLSTSRFDDSLVLSSAQTWAYNQIPDCTSPVSRIDFPLFG